MLCLLQPRQSLAALLYTTPITDNYSSETFHEAHMPLSYKWLASVLHQVFTSTSALIVKTGLTVCLKTILKTARHDKDLTGQEYIFKGKCTTFYVDVLISLDGECSQLNQ